MDELTIKKKATNEIVDMLQNEGINIDDQKVINTIQLIIHETFEKGKEIGVSKGKKTGFEKACLQIRNNIMSMIEV